MKITAAYVCNLGKMRSENQDNIYFHGMNLELKHWNAHSRFQWRASTKRAVCMGVFDGMGGEQHGELASYLASEVWKAEMLEDRKGKIPGDILSETCHAANDAIYRKTQELGAGRIGTTAAVIYMQYDRIWCCNVGDSRIYRLRDGVLAQLSYDHTGESYGQTGKKPGLTQHLGMDNKESRLFPHIVDDSMLPGDRYLLCSDGLTDMVSVDGMKEILGKTASPKKSSRALLQKALENGGRDNITIIVFGVR